MPDPTQQQFEAASRVVAQSAPEGLSKDQFYGLVEKEIAHQSSGVPSASLAEGFRSAGRNGTSEADFNAPPNALKGMLSGPAHPEGLGDVLSLLIPSGIAEAAGTAGRMLKSGYNYAKPAEGVTGRLKGFFQGMKEHAYPSDSVDKMLGRGGAPIQDVGATPAPAGPDLIDKYRTPPTKTPIGKLTGTKAPTAESSISDALQELMGRSRSDPAKASTGVPQVEMTPTGKPGTTASRADEIVSTAKNAPPAQPIAVEDPIDIAIREGKLPANARSRIASPGNRGPMPFPQRVEEALTQQLGSGNGPMTAVGSPAEGAPSPQTPKSVSPADVASKSSSPRTAGTPELTPDDLGQLGLSNPTLKVTGMTEDAAKMMKDARARRAIEHRVQAELEKAMRSAVERDQ